MYNYAIPQADLDAEASCAVDGTCGAFFLRGWVPEPYGTADRAPSAGTITPLQGIVSPGVQPGDNGGGILGEQYRSTDLWIHQIYARSVMPPAQVGVSPILSHADAVISYRSYRTGGIPILRQSRPLGGL